MKSIFVFGITAFFLSGCISINLPRGESSPSKRISASAPGGPYKALSAEGFDRAWISSTTGNTIAYTSECSPSADLSPEQLFNEFVGHITGVKTSFEPFEIADRSGIRGQATGTLDGVPVQLAVVVFKKDGCDYVLNYSGITEKFESELPLFEQFLANIEVSRK